jgi:hypothetical protein
MNQKHRKLIEAEAMARWHYLKTDAAITVVTITGITGMVFSLVGLCASGFWLVEAFPDTNVISPSEASIFLRVVLTIASGGTTLFCGWLLRYSAQKSETLQYVPPAHEQVLTLPAAKVLVRGSDQPAATPDELLRAAHSGTETTSDDLLHPTENPAP